LSKDLETKKKYAEKYGPLFAAIIYKIKNLASFGKTEMQ